MAVSREERGLLKRLKGEIAAGERSYKAAVKTIEKLMGMGWTYAAIGREIGRSGDWVRKIVAWATDPDGPPPSPFAEPQREPRDMRGAKAVLRAATPTQIDELLDDLPDRAVSSLASLADQRVHLRAVQRAEGGGGGLTETGRRKAAAAQPSRKALALVRVLASFDRARESLLSGLRQYSDGEWTAREVAKVREFVERTRAALEMTETALDSETDTDWDAALAELSKEA